jgi:hypothetical protein
LELAIIIHSLFLPTAGTGIYRGPQQTIHQLHRKQLLQGGHKFIQLQFGPKIKTFPQSDHSQSVKSRKVNQAELSGGLAS